MRESIAEKHRGKGWMAGDFNEPLDGFRDYM